MTPLVQLQFQSKQKQQPLVAKVSLSWKAKGDRVNTHNQSQACVTGFFLEKKMIKALGCSGVWGGGGGGGGCH